jgi:hypothetical protein
MLRQVAAGAALVAVAAAVLLWEPVIRHEAVRLAPRSALFLEASVAAPAGPAASVAGSARAPASLPRNGLAAAYARTTDMRAFVLDAMQRPKEGGHLYARAALAECFTHSDRSVHEQAIRRVVASTGTVSLKQMEASDRLLRRCASLAGGEAQRLYRLLIEHPGAIDDPMLQMQRALQAGHLPGDTLRRFVARIFEADDAMLYAVLEQIAERDPEALAAEGIRFGDRILRERDGPDDRYARLALETAGCKENSWCAWDSVAENNCALGGMCANGWRAHVTLQLQLEGHSQDGIARFWTFSDRVRTAIDGKDVSFFVR